MHVVKWAVGKSRRPAGEGAIQSGGGRQILGSDAKPRTYDSVVVDALCEEQFVFISFLFLGQVVRAHLLRERGECVSHPKDNVPTHVSCAERESLPENNQYSLMLREVR